MSFSRTLIGVVAICLLASRHRSGCGGTNWQPDLAFRGQDK